MNDTTETLPATPVDDVRARKQAPIPANIGRKNTMELFSVSGGKFHKPATAPTREEAWKPRLTVCGRTLIPVNFFKTAHDADCYTGGQLHLYLCRYCARAKIAA